MAGPSNRSLPLPGTVLSELKGHVGPVSSVRFNAQGEYCMTAGKDRTVKLWNPVTGKCLKNFTGHNDNVNEAVASRDNSKIVSGGDDKQAILWDVGGEAGARKFRGHVGRVNCVAISDDASVVLSGSYDATVCIWDCRSNARDPIQTLKDAKDSVTSLRLEGHKIITGCVDGYVRVYDIRAGKIRSDFIGYPVTCVRFSNDGNCILVSTLNNSVLLMDQQTGEMLNEFRGHKNSDFRLDSGLTHNDQYVVSGSEDGRICFWDLVNAKIVQTLEAHKAAVTTLDPHPTLPRLLSASTDGMVRLWGAEQEEEEL